MTIEQLTETDTALASQSAGAVRILGGEMLDGSDAPYGVTALHFIAPVLPASGHVLIAGPHDPELVERIVTPDRAVEAHLRRLPDARRAAIRSAHHKVITYCGDPERLRGSYDAVLAIDGLARLAGPDSTVDGWRPAIDRLATLVAEGGVLAVLVENGIGIDHLTSAPYPDDIWVDNHTDGFATSYRAIVRRICDAGMVVHAAVAVYPTIDAPALFVHREMCRAEDDVLPALVAASYTSALAARGTDPRRIARDAVAHGLGFELAPGWLLIAGRPAADRSAPMPQVPVQALIGDDPGLPYWAVPRVVERDGSGGWRQRPAQTGTPAVRGLGHLGRDLARLDGLVPSGTLLEEKLVRACGRHDTGELRDLLDRYARWLGLGTSGICPPGHVFAVTDNVIDADGQFHMVDPSWTTALPVSPDLAFLRSLRRFADRLLSGGYAHPWPLDTSPDRLATYLAAMAGLAVTAAQRDGATRLAVDLDGPLIDPTGALDDERHAELVAAYAASTRTVLPPRGYAEAVHALSASITELSMTREQVRWLSETIEDRDARLSAKARELTVLRTSLTYRLGYALTLPAHAALRVLRRLSRSARVAVR